MKLAKHFAAAPHVRMAAISLIVIAAGPERVVQRAREAAARLESPSTEVVIVPAGSMSPGAARNAGVHQSTGACFLIIDGSEQLPPGTTRQVPFGRWTPRLMPPSRLAAAAFRTGGTTRW